MQTVYNNTETEKQLVSIHSFFRSNSYQYAVFFVFEKSRYTTYGLPHLTAQWSTRTWTTETASTCDQSHDHVGYMLRQLQWGIGYDEYSGRSGIFRRNDFYLQITMAWHTYVHASMRYHHNHSNDILSATLRGSRPGVQSASLIMTSLTDDVITRKL